MNGRNLKKLGKQYEFIKTKKMEPKKKKIPQNKIILNHLKNKGSITSWEAIQAYGITRLAARIFDLKEAGHDIKPIEINQNNSKFTKYVLE